MIACRSCGARPLVSLLSLGEMPLANALLGAGDLDLSERSYPLELALCEGCGLAQLTESVAPVELFQHYPYFSSYSSTVLAHVEELVSRIVNDRRLGPQSLAMEIASNDGYLLQFYARRGIPVLGIDPARNVAEKAIERGVETLCAFFDDGLGEELRASGHRADVLHANNVLAHVPNLNGVVRGIARVLADDGVAVIETPYVRDLVERLEFDTIYHEHVFYYSLTSLQPLFERHDLRIADVERIPIHGGSLRVFVTLDSAKEASPRVAALLEEERALQLGSAAYFRDLATQVASLRHELLALLRSLRDQGARIAAYGAAAKGTVLLNAFGIGRETIDFVADRSDYKQGLYMPGVHLPIVSPKRLLTDQPDAVLLLAWNFADEVLDQQREYIRRGGRFIIPAPTPRIVGADT